jgi:hypothetical protein
MARLDNSIPFSIFTVPPIFTFEIVSKLNTFKRVEGLLVTINTFCPSYL